MQAFYFMLIVVIPGFLKETQAIDSISWDDDDLNRTLIIWWPEKIDNDIWKSLNSIQNLLDTNPSKNLNSESDFEPYLDKVIEIASTLESMFTKFYLWNVVFKMYGNYRPEVPMSSAPTNIKKSVDCLARQVAGGEGNNNRASEMKRCAEEIRSILDDVITSVDKLHEGLEFRKEPLLLAPFLIEIGLIVAAIEPVLGYLLENEVRDKMSCKMRDVTLDFLPFMVASRLEKMHTKMWPVIEIRYLEYNSNGYEDPEGIKCHKMIDPTCTTFYPGEKNVVRDCLVDNFGTLQFFKGDVEWKRHACEMSYARHVRTLVERTFPIGLLNKTCGEDPRQPTGNLLLPRQK